MANVMENPEMLAYLWATLKVQFENTISRFYISSGWRWTEFAKICTDKTGSNPTDAYLWVIPNSGLPHEARAHFTKVTYLILLTAKEFWLPRCELVPDEHIAAISSQNLRHLNLTSGQQVQWKDNMELAARKQKFKRCLGGLYLMWALYWNQPCLPKNYQRIPITAHDWATMKAFEGELETIPIEFRDEGKRTSFTKQVQSMLRSLIVAGAYDVCVFAELHNLIDHAYLNSKYNGIIQALEWEKGLKEMLLFHPVICTAFKEYKEKMRCFQEAVQHSAACPEIIAEAMSITNNSIPTRTGPGEGDGECSSAKKPKILTDQDKILHIGKTLRDAILTSPYKMEYLLTPEAYEHYRKFKRAAPKVDQDDRVRRSRFKASSKSKAASALESEPAPEQPTNYDSLESVVKALGILNIDYEDLKLKSQGTSISSGASATISQACSSQPSTSAQLFPQGGKIRVQPEWELSFSDNREQLENALVKHHRRVQVKNEAAAAGGLKGQSSSHGHGDVKTKKTLKLDSSDDDDDDDDLDPDQYDHFALGAGAGIGTGTGSSTSSSSRSEGELSSSSSEEESEAEAEARGQRLVKASAPASAPTGITTKAAAAAAPEAEPVAVAGASGSRSFGLKSKFNGGQDDDDDDEEIDQIIQELTDIPNLLSPLGLGDHII